MLKLFNAIHAKSQALLTGEHQTAPADAQEETADSSGTLESTRVTGRKARFRWKRIRERYDEVKAAAHTMQHHSIPTMVQAAKSR